MTRAHVVVPYTPSNSSVRARAVHWVERLVGAGRVQRDEVVMHGPGFGRERVPEHAPVFLLRNARRLTRGGFERRLLERASLGVYDLDDGLPWDDGRLPGLGRWSKRAFPRSLVAARAASAADRLVVGNEVLADWGSEYCPDVRLIPTCVEPSDYRPRTSWEVGERPTIGWIGSPATEPYLLEIGPALEEVNRRSGARLHMISGAGNVPPSLARFTTKTSWSPASPASIGSWDIGIMPLRDGVYERAKCGYKLLQYAASGVPAVGSPVGINRRLIDEMDGVATSSLDEWVDALMEMIDSWESSWLDAVGW
jgi:glycosyltransferase involved in cell wall biosynthesis